MEICLSTPFLALQPDPRPRWELEGCQSRVRRPYTGRLLQAHYFLRDSKTASSYSRLDASYDLQTVRLAFVNASSV
jgi:hypothetical protein